MCLHWQHAAGRVSRGSSHFPSKSPGWMNLKNGTVFLQLVSRGKDAWQKLAWNGSISSIFRGQCLINMVTLIFTANEEFIKINAVHIGLGANHSPSQMETAQTFPSSGHIPNPINLSGSFQRHLKHRETWLIVVAEQLSSLLLFGWNLSLFLLYCCFLCYRFCLCCLLGWFKHWRHFLKCWKETNNHK